ncbi:MAG TPA: fused MFS/spermidine synthase [Candidatus Acidoferrales bacterium]|nr:fused MFS/spermidine synthase [Candidatus Acidoferrales bacterium]
MILYALTILVSAFLLFQVQPVIAKIILPWFGGSAAVWTTCLLFFQMVLLLGYLYAHALVRYLTPRRQMLVHGAMLLLSLVALPVYPSASWKPAGTEEPTLRILTLLAVTVGLPYFLLSTTGPLLQAWYARRYKGSIPYRLYALSNAGSMFALISYPVLFEPSFGTRLQAYMWSGGFVVFVLLCGLVAWRSGSDAAESAAGSAAPETASDPPPALKDYLMWLLLPATASVLLLAISNHLSQNVAAIPFLWVLPLSIYLLTFILCFEGEGWYRRNPYLQLLAVALGSMAYTLNDTLDKNTSLKLPVIGDIHIPAVFMLIALFSLGLFTCCMVCHGELARLKPHPRYLTQYFLMISAGGAVGGLLVGLMAPHLFNALYEMPAGLALCAVVALIACRATPEWDWLKELLAPERLALAAIVIGVLGFWKNSVWLALFRGRSFEENTEKTILGVGLALAILIVLCVVRMGVAWVRRPAAWAAVAAELLALGLIGFVGYEIKSLTGGYRLAVRNFYGALKVRDNGIESSLTATRTLTHGTINHGEEFLHFTRRDWPTTYYGPNTGVGITIREKQNKGAIRVGVIGLGTGTVAAYGRLGDYYRYYEINPLVLNIARTQFYFLPGCKAKLDVAMGDARLSLERESPEHFDVLAVDAFSSDSIPVHLLTKEAMELYFRHLQPDGILAVHISNRYLNLQPVLAGETRALDKVARIIDTEDDEDTDVFGATWVLIASPATGFSGEEMTKTAPLEPKTSVRLWTDDYSNLFKILK